jgi:hypothetical protein
MPSSRSPSRVSDSPQAPDAQGGGGDPPAPEEGGGGGGGGGDLVKVAFASSLMEAEMIQGLLAEYGIPSMLKRGPGFDIPEFMSAGPRQVFVARETAPLAREVLAGTPGAC